MAARSAGEVPRCRACNQALLLIPRPEAVPAYTCASSAVGAAPCPFCGFLNRPSPDASIVAATLTLVRPAEGRRPVPAEAGRRRELPIATAEPKVCPFISLLNHQDVESASVTAA